MRCEILSLARSLEKDPNLVCKEECNTHDECFFSNDDLVFPKADINEGPHNENIIDGANMDVEEIVENLNGNGVKKNVVDDLLQQIYDASVFGNGRQEDMRV